MDIKEFKVGETCYRLGYRNNNIEHMVVRKVGHKYVEAASSAASYYTTKFLNREKELGLPEKPYLTEVSDIGYPSLLFLTEQAAKDYIEHQTLYQSVRKVIGRSRPENYTLDQLRRIRAILDETQNQLQEED